MFHLKNRNSRTCEGQEGQDERKPISRSALVFLFVSIALTVAVYTVYRFLMQQSYFVTALYVYVAIACLSLFGYVIYNRGFSRRGVTVEMLPDTMSEAQKLAFVEDAAKRLKRSRWLLCVTFAFFVTFALDLFEIFALPLVKRILGM